MSQEAKDAKEAVERLEALVRSLTGETRRDVAETRREVAELRAEVGGRFEGVEKRLATAEERGDDLLVVMRQIQSSQVAMSSALTQAVTQLALSRDLDKRVERLEAAVFPSKH
ncbi:MAG: hypothetical protein ACYC8T_09975 [Myxococcaceae bacterium]